MRQEVEISRHVSIHKGDLTKRSIVRTLMLQLLHEKASKQHGYFLAITKLKSISKEQVLVNHSISFQVSFKCRMFLPIRGETLQGIVYLVKPLGVIIKCGPTKHAYLSALKMPGYHLVTGKEPYFENERLDRIGRGVVVCFKVLDVKWVEDRPSNGIKREFQMLVSLETGEPFGPVSLPGYDISDI